MATTEQMHLITVPRARLHQCTPVPVGRRRAVEPVQEEWRRHYPVFPRLTAAAIQDALPASAVQVINDCSAQGRAAAILTPEGERQWRLNSASCVEDALSVIAADAISVIAGERDGRLALCASPTCRAAFFDTSQSRTRKWCDMNTCGNRQKKARFQANQRKNPRSAE
ncbi:CGNR zinc finger domain-containing protein [Streptomyces sp. NPDC048253]|uniref:CGNR zinc finger domain-containing protein n=1 Tax=Streptomyces sp. NPDC048253 TaxID=3365524 RepID=UPI0037222D73